MHSFARPLLAFCLLIAACAGVTPPPASAQEQPIEIRSASLPFKIDEPGSTQIGRLIWRGGVSMTANSASFGGWSDLHVSADGRTLTSISDLGAWLTAAIDYDAKGDLVGLSAARIGQLRGLDGKPIAGKIDADAEAMARLPDGSWLVAFERHHRIWRYPTLQGAPAPVEGPADIGRLPPNGGIEAMTALADNRVIAISEEYRRRPDTVTGWVGSRKPDGRYQWRAFDYPTIPDFHPTAIARLPDGSFVTLERAFDFVRGVRCRVMRFAAADLEEGGIVRPQELARLASPYAVDNLEGLAAGKGRNGETLLWLISDDNFNPLQRNILMMFELAEP
ncbi:esterase-like activity of phytase family protein [Reyranella sp.]|uniref:esterase-like activity of phytase family protein n=1 Tax=Reyranella sp. TaxID=1929291 RepID=UPI0037833946